MQRYNIFNLVHKGLRASLYHTAILLQQTDFTDEKETETVVEKVREIIMLFESHAAKEDQYILPAISEFEPGVAASFNDEHIEDDALGKRLDACLTKLITADGLLERSAAGRELNVIFAAFTALLF